MSGLRLVFPVDELRETVDAAAVALVQQRKDMLEILGVQLLALTKTDYETKASGGAGSDGTTWAPITVGTLLARLRKAGHIKSKPVSGTKIPKGVPIAKNQRSITVVAKTVKGNQDLFKQLAKAGVKFRDKSGKIVKGTGARHKAGTFVGSTAATRNKTVAVGNYQIGIDTGLQRNSASPGYVAPDGKGGNIMEVADAVVTVGYGRSYSEHFDKKRKLIPEVLPPEWIEALEEHAAKLGGEIIQETLDQRGAS